MFNSLVSAAHALLDSYFYEEINDYLAKIALKTSNNFSPVTIGSSAYLLVYGYFHTVN